MNRDSVVSAILTDLFGRYTALDQTSCMFIHEFCEAIAKQLSIGRVLLGLITKSKEQKFITELTEICKSPATVYGSSYYSILRLLWLRFKETEVIEDNKKVLELYRLLDYSMRFTLIQKVNYIVHNVGHMLHLHPQALPLTEVIIDVRPSLQQILYNPVTNINNTINNIYINDTLALVEKVVDKPIKKEPTASAATASASAVAAEPTSDCPVCMTNKNDTALISCGHVICGTCANHLHNSTKRCPICRNVFTNVLKIYL